MSNAGSFGEPGAGLGGQNGADIGQTLSSARASLDETLRTKVDQNPWGVLGIALAAGYVAGGGIFTPLTAKLLGLGVRLGIRMALVPMVRNEIASLAGAARQGVAS